MKIICVKEYLKEAVNLCERICGKNLSLPILNNILISAESNRILKFTATNLEIGIEVEVPAKVEQKGKVAVPAGIINTFLSNFSGDENITFESQNNNLLISTANSSTLVKGQLSEDFPIIPKLENGKEIIIPIKDLISGLKSVWYSCSFSNIKPELSSVYFYSKNLNQALFAATDSFRLAEKQINGNFLEIKNLLIPLKSVTEILRIFDGKNGNIKILFNKNQINLQTDTINFISRLTEGIFPDYQQIIPKKFATDVVVDKNIFVNALKTAGIFSGKLNELNVMVGQNDSIALKTSSAEIGEHLTNIPAKITGDKIKITFNHKYIFDSLQHISSEKILLRFSGDNRPLLITGVDDTSFQYLVMPMNSL